MVLLHLVTEPRADAELSINMPAMESAINLRDKTTVQFMV